MTGAGTVDSRGPAWFVFAGAALVATVARRRVADREQTSPESTAMFGDVAIARAELRAASTASEPFAVLAANAGLDEESAEVFAVLAGAEADPDLRDLVSSLHGDVRRGRVTLGLLATVFGNGIFGDDHPGPRAVARLAPLRRAAFVDVRADGPWSDHEVLLHPGVVWALRGDGAPDADLPDGTETRDDAPDDGDGDPTQSVADLVIVNGPDRIRRRHAGARAGLSSRYLCAPAPDTEAGWAALVREATMTGSGILVDLGSELGPIGRSWVERATHLTWVLSASTGPELGDLPERAWLQVHADASEPTDAEWAAAFGGDAPRHHPLTADQLHRVGAAFRRSLSSDATDDPAEIARTIDAAVRRLVSGELEQLTTRLTPTRTWADVVISPERLDQLRGMVERYRNRHRVYDEWGFPPSPSRGLVALFSGPSGTGKTLAAEVIAMELGLDLFRIDLSAMVSKYIGETEKNLSKVFDAAERSASVLFFDEADALFGKRSEVRDARDRYANIEVSYLLQRLERYDGIVIMTTNLEKNIDDAFLRRIHERVQFAMPGVDERLAIWRGHLVPPAPLGDVDLDWLAERFELTGGTIKNASLQAAFLAAHDDEPIGMKHLVLGVASELRKSGRLVKDAEFGEYRAFLSR